MLGKSENWLMLSFCDGADMYFKGDDSPAAFVDVSVFGKSTDAQCENMTKKGKYLRTLCESAAVLESSRKAYPKAGGGR